MPNVILKQSDGINGYHFFHSLRNGICLSTINKGNLKPFESLMPEALPDFDCIIDGTNNIHLICQDINANLTYLMYSNEQWHKFVVLKSKSGASIGKNFRIIRNGNFLCTLYALEYKGEKLLSYQLLDDADRPPEIIDILGANGNFFVSKDNSGNINVFYKKGDSEIGLGIKSFNWSRKKWLDFAPVTKRDIENPYLFSDSRETMHLAGTNGRDLMYSRKDAGNSLAWEDARIFKNVTDRGSRPIISFRYDRMWIEWQSGGRMLGISSKDGGKTWEKPSELASSRGKSMMLFKLSNAKSDKILMSDWCWGRVSNNKFSTLWTNNYFEEVKRQEIQTVVQEGFEVEEFAADFLNTNKPKAANDIDREEIEREKARIREQMFREETEKNEMPEKDVKSANSRPFTNPDDPDELMKMFDNVYDAGGGSIQIQNGDFAIEPKDWNAYFIQNNEISAERVKKDKHTKPSKPQEIPPEKVVEEAEEDIRKMPPETQNEESDQDSVQLENQMSFKFIEVAPRDEKDEENKKFYEKVENRLNKMEEKIDKISESILKLAEKRSYKRKPKIEKDEDV